MPTKRKHLKLLKLLRFEVTRWDSVPRPTYDVSFQGRDSRCRTGHWKTRRGAEAYGLEQAVRIRMEQARDARDLTEYTQFYQWLVKIRPKNAAR